MPPSTALLNRLIIHLEKSRKGCGRTRAGFSFRF
jgi:hypothetical protein